jgi:hypothetical protein
MFGQDLLRFEYRLRRSMTSEPRQFMCLPRAPLSNSSGKCGRTIRMVELFDST